MTKTKNAPKKNIEVNDEYDEYLEMFGVDVNKLADQDLLEDEDVLSSDPQLEESNDHAASSSSVEESVSETKEVLNEDTATTNTTDTVDTAESDQAEFPDTLEEERESAILPPKKKKNHAENSISTSKSDIFLGMQDDVDSYSETLSPYIEKVKSNAKLKTCQYGIYLTKVENEFIDYLAFIKRQNRSKIIRTAILEYYKDDFVKLEQSGYFEQDNV